MNPNNEPKTGPSETNQVVVTVNEPQQSPTVKDILSYDLANDVKVDFVLND